MFSAITPNAEPKNIMVYQQKYLNKVPRYLKA